MLVILITAIPGSANTLPSNHKVAGEVLVGLPGSGASEKRSSFSLVAECSLCVYQSRVKNPAGTVLHSCASTSLTQRIAPQANSHPSAAKACKSVGLQDCGSEVGKRRAGQLLLSPVPTGVFAGGWDC